MDRKIGRRERESDRGMKSDTREGKCKRERESSRQWKMSDISQLHELHESMTYKKKEKKSDSLNTVDFQKIEHYFHSLHIYPNYNFFYWVINQLKWRTGNRDAMIGVPYISIKGIQKRVS